MVVVSQVGNSLSNQQGERECLKGREEVGMRDKENKENKVNMGT